MKGAKETLRTHRPIILTEVNKPYNETRKNSLDEIFFPIIPPNYKIFKFNTTYFAVGGEGVKQHYLSGTNKIKNTLFKFTN